MPRYIDADAFLRRAESMYCLGCEKRMGIKNGEKTFIYGIGGVPCRACEVDDMKVDIEYAPTADVVERKRGKWIYYPKASGSATSTAVHLYPVCSECGCEHPIANYCPNCGVQMEANDGEIH